MNLNALLPLILSDRAVKPKAKCYMCGEKQCVLQYCDIHVAGVGEQEFRNSTSAVAAWAATVRATKPKVVVLETSDRFRGEILDSLFGDIYAIEGLKLGGPFFGWAGKSDRYYAVMVSKDS